MTDNTLQYFWRDRSISREYRAGVSLHSHTMYSEESLAMIPRYTVKVPFLSGVVRQHEQTFQEKRRHVLDFARAFWAPPLSPRQAYRLEEKQIQHELQLPGLVSITDHDDIRAGSQLHVLDRFRESPISTEWTVPFGPTFFHFGVHNLPVHESAAIMATLRQFTRNPAEAELPQILAMLNERPDVLLVLNHPLWDEQGIGVAEHAQMLGRLIERHGRALHAVELNGLRSWRENKQVIWLSKQTGLPVVSGGDRHGLEPNAILNLTRGTTLAEFIHEVRYRRQSHVVFMPQYHEPIKMRILQTMVDILKDYPEEFEGRRTWTDRVFFRFEPEGEPVPLTKAFEDRPPALMRYFVGAVRLLERRSVRSALRMALHDRASSWTDREVAV